MALGGLLGGVKTKRQMIAKARLIQRIDLRVALQLRQRAAPQPEKKSVEKASEGLVGVKIKLSKRGAPSVMLVIGSKGARPQIERLKSPLKIALADQSRKRALMKLMARAPAEIAKRKRKRGRGASLPDQIKALGKKLSALGRVERGPELWAERSGAGGGGGGGAHEGHYSAGASEEEKQAKLAGRRADDDSVEKEGGAR